MSGSQLDDGPAGRVADGLLKTGNGPMGRTYGGNPIHQVVKRLREEEYNLIRSMEALDEDALVASTQALVDDGYTDHQIEGLLQQGMQKAEQKFESGEYFLGDLVVAGLLFKTGLELLPASEEPIADGQSNGIVVIGVMADDIHDIGKDIVVQVLRAENFEVHDLGVDVPLGKFMAAIDEYHPDILALSGVMATSTEAMADVVNALEEKGLRARIPVIIGGSCASEFVRNHIKADAFAKGPVDTMLYCRQFMKTRHGGGDGAQR